MFAPQEEFYSKPDTEVWFLFDLRDARQRPRLRARLDREKRAWGRHASVETLGRRVFVLIVRAGGALELSR